MEAERKKRRIMQGVGQRIRQLREQLNYSPKEMAARLGINLSGYHKNEKGQNLPNLVTLQWLQKEYGISMDWFLFGLGPMHYEEKVVEPPEEMAEAVAEEQPPAKEELMPDVQELVDHMAADPLLRHKVLLFFYEYKNKKDQAHEPAPAQEPEPLPDPEK